MRSIWGADSVIVDSQRVHRHWTFPLHFGEVPLRPATRYAETATPTARIPMSTAVPGLRRGGIASSPVRRDRTPVPASATTNGRTVKANARNARRDPVSHGTRRDDHAPTIARRAAKTAATRGFQFSSGGGGEDGSLENVTCTGRSASGLFRWSMERNPIA